MELTDEERLKALGEMSADEWQGAEAAFMGKKPTPVAPDDGIDTRPIDAAASYPAELWSKPVQGPELLPAADESDTPNYSERAQPEPVAPAASSEPEDDRAPLPSGDARTSRPSASSSFDSERLRMLDAIASGDDEGRLRKAFEEDRRSAAEDRLSEALVGMARGAPVTFTTKMPSRAAEESALNSRRDKLNELRARMMRGQGRSGVPPEYYQAQIDRWKAEDARKRKEADDKGGAAAAKAQADKLATEADAASLEKEKSLFLRSPQAQKYKIKPEDLASMTRKGFEEYTKRIGWESKGKLRPSGPSKLDEAHRKEGLKRTAGMPAGYELNEDANPLDDQKKQLFKADVSEKKLRGLTSQMRKALVPPKNASQLPEWRRHLKTLATAVQLEAKNVAELGALSGPDMALMEALADDPSKIISQTGLRGDMSKMLDDLDAWGANSTRSVADAIGARPKGAAPKAAKKVTVRKGEEQYDIDEADLQDAISDGYEVVR